MATSRQPLYNAQLQNDLDGKSLNINNLNQIDVVQSGMVYVDPNLPDEIGKIDSLMAFQTLETAIRLAPPNYVIVMRPGTYRYDGLLLIKRSHIKIMGTGAIISPLTANGTAGLTISGSFVSIDGLIFDGEAIGAPANTGTVIEITTATNVELKNLIIRDQQGDAITLSDRYESCTIDNCSVTGCQNAIIAGIESANSISTLTFSNNTIQNMRANGITIECDSALAQFADIKIVGNDIVTVDQDGGSSSSISILNGTTNGTPGSRNIVIANNYVSKGFYGIYLQQCSDITISNNSFAGMDSIMIWLQGCKSGTINNNLLDGANPSNGAPQADIGIQLSAGFGVDFVADTGPFVVSSNIVTGISSGGKFVNAADINNTSLIGNQFTANAFLQVLSFTNLKVSENIFNVTSTNPVIVLGTSATGSWTGCTISHNQFKLTGVRGTLIQTADAGAFGQSNITIVGNWSTPGQVYSQGIYHNTAGAVPTGAFINMNYPETATLTAGEYDSRQGWVNDYRSTFTATHVNIPTIAFNKYQVGGSQVVGARVTGWTVPTGAQRRSTFDTSTVTLSQLAEVVNALIRDLHAASGHGLIGTTAGEAPINYHYS